MNSSLFLRSNGDLVCWDDVGCNKVLQRYDPSIDYANDVFLGRVHGEIRAAFASGRAPFRECRQGCLALNTEHPFSTQYVDLRRVTYFQVESSFACQLKCPSCYPGVKRAGVLERTCAGHLNLEPGVVEKILTDFRRAGVAVGLVEFQGHGEPLINRKIWEMVSTCRRLYPHTEIRIVTNANFTFTSLMVESGVSEIVFSIDGVDQPSYVPYRVGGQFEKAYAFMRDFCGAVRDRELPIKTIWKYVLFEHNSSDEHLLKLRRLAEDAGVGEVLLIVTQLGDTSKRFFKAFLELQARADRDEYLRRFVARLDFKVPTRDLSNSWKRALGWSPIPDEFLLDDETPPHDFMRDPLARSRSAPEWRPMPERLALDGRTRLYSFAYLALQRDLGADLREAARVLEAGLPGKAGDALMALSHRLERLYDRRAELLIPDHADLIQRVLKLLPSLPSEIQGVILSKLSAFADHLPRANRGWLRRHVRDVGRALFRVIGDWTWRGRGTRRNGSRPAP